MSTSSGRSRRTAEDFEAALLKPHETLFLSASASPQDSPGSPPNPHHPALHDVIHLDDEAPVVVDKRSFDEDYTLDPISTSGPNGRFASSASASASGAGAGAGGSASTADGFAHDVFGTPRRPSEVEVIPPTPTTVASRETAMTTRTQSQNQNQNQGQNQGQPSANAMGRRPSHATQGSIGSAGSTPTRVLAKGKAMGLDAEVAAAAQTASPVAKRRSIFRSAATASSPDLATLVRRAKGSSSNPPPMPDPPKSAKFGRTHHVRPPLPTAPSTGTRASSTSASTSASVSGVGPHGRGSMAGSEEGRARAGSTSTAGESEMRPWVGVGSGMETISEKRSRQGSEDGFKTMRSRAKGVFGRMFGGSGSTREPSQSPAATHSRAFPNPPAAPQTPQVPQIASTYTMQTEAVRRKDPPPSIDVFGTVSSVSPVSPSTRPRSTIDSPALTSKTDGRRSVTPTMRSTESGGSATTSATVAAPAPADKPLPPIRDDEVSPPAPRGLGIASLHVRQPAYTIPESPSSETPGVDEGPSLEPTFSQDVAGALASIGQESPARELGLPPDSLKLRVKKRSPLDDERRFPVELGRSASDRQYEKRSPVPSQRTTSLPNHGAIMPPSPQPRRSSTPLTATDMGLVPPPQVSSHSRSLPSSPEMTNGATATATATAAGKLSKPMSEPINQKPTLPTSHPSTSPIDSDMDFTPPIDNEGTVRGKSPSYTSSVRLVTTPHQTPPLAVDEGSQGRSPETLHESSQPSTIMEHEQVPEVDEPEGEDDEEKGRKLACEFLEENFEHVPSDKVAMFLGGPRPIHSVALRYYMKYFDMKGQNLVDAFRDLCSKLHLKAESQEIDRIIEGFSARYFECNPTTVFGSAGVVHTVTGAMLMLNTDLHIADLSKHMSRADFVRNAMRAIQESMPDRTSTPDLVRDGSSSRYGSMASVISPTSTATSPPPVPPAGLGTVRAKPPVTLPTQRSASAPVVGSPIPAQRVVSEVAMPSNPESRASSITVSSFSYTKSWELEAENALKDIFAAVRSDRILLPINSAVSRQSMLSSSSLDLNRNRTMRSPSDRVNALKRGSIRGVQGLLNNPYNGSFAASDGRLSPTPSYATSINETATAFAASLGFASNLSHTVIREHEDEVASVDSHTSLSTLDEMDDDELALLGAPWAKEGMLQHKQYWESAGKRAKKNEWKQFFVVVSKGELFMFTFGDRGGAGFAGGSVGGGNWLTNANPVGKLDLMHAMAAALPKPGYSAERPHCFSIVLPSGQTTFFQAGTEDLVSEWVATCNYWSARRSRQPLTGGVSNMEYGWQKVVPVYINGASDEHDRDHDHDHDDKASVRSGRSSMSKLGGTYGRRTLAPADRMHINDWRPPMPASMPSPLDEEAQLEALQVYIESLKKELDEHKAIEEPMIRQYSANSKNVVKARDNWRARSHYIHTEIVKYKTYVDALRAAISQRVKQQGERKLEKSLQRSNASLHRRDSGDALSRFTSTSGSAKA
ncbi:hypothetical protein JCM24511_06756 [Saitozyma sp. JCM 24511]|nr:hypothetical protein JCM24511_06756 [Saitozyma sp. JCM 24511]